MFGLYLSSNTILDTRQILPLLVHLLSIIIVVCTFIYFLIANTETLFQFFNKDTKEFESGQFSLHQAICICCLFFKIDIFFRSLLLHSYSYPHFTIQRSHAIETCFLLKRITIPNFNILCLFVVMCIQDQFGILRGLRFNLPHYQKILKIFYISKLRVQFRLQVKHNEMLQVTKNL